MDCHRILYNLRLSHPLAGKTMAEGGNANPTLVHFDGTTTTILGLKMNLLHMFNLTSAKDTGVI